MRECFLQAYMATLRTSKLSTQRATIHGNLVWNPSVSNTYYPLDYAPSAYRTHDGFMMLEQRHSEALVRVSDGCGEAISDRVVIAGMALQRNYFWNHIIHSWNSVGQVGK